MSPRESEGSLWILEQDYGNGWQMIGGGPKTDCEFARYLRQHIEGDNKWEITSISYGTVVLDSSIADARRRWRLAAD